MNPVVTYCNQALIPPIVTFSIPNESFLMDRDLMSPAANLSREIIARMGDKWTLIVIYTLGDGPIRFSALKKKIGDISQKMLSQTLRGLERDGIVTRTVLPTSPPMVEYALKPSGRDLHKAVSSICTWATTYVEEVRAARAAFDRHITSGRSPAAIQMAPLADSILEPDYRL